MATFDDALAAYDYLLLNDVDGVFADIEMPELNGVEFAEKLLAIRPQIHIVFTTAYAEKAAAQLHTAVYLIRKTLLPLESEIQLHTVNSMYTLNVSPTRVDFLEFRALAARIADPSIDFDVKEIRDLRILGSDILIDISAIWIEPFRAMMDQLKQEFIINIMSRHTNQTHTHPTLSAACRLLVADYMLHADDDENVIIMIKRGLESNGIKNADAIIQDVTRKTE